MKIIKQELEFEECLKQRLEFICEFSKVTPTFINGSIRKLERTMKNTDMLYWVGTMNFIKSQAEEIVLSELIYV